MMLCTCTGNATDKLSDAYYYPEFHHSVREDGISTHDGREAGRSSYPTPQVSAG